MALLPLVTRNGEAAFASRLADYNDIIGAADAALIEAALEVCPALRLHEIRKDSSLHAALDGRFLIEHEPARPVIWTPLSTYEAWLAARSRAFRKALFRAERAAAARGLAVRELDASEVGDGEIFLSLHDAHPRQSCFMLEEHRAFARRVIPPLLERRAMRAFAVLDGDCIVAIDVCTAGARSLCTWNTGYLPDYAEVSPGNLLMAHEIRTACAEGLPEFDLGRGDEPYKLRWASERRRLIRARVCARRSEATDRAIAPSSP